MDGPEFDDGTEVTRVVNITVTDVNEAPTVDDSEPAGVSTVFENHNNTLEDIDADPGATPPIEQAARVVLGTFDATDEDIGDGTDGTQADSSQLRLSLGGEDAGDFKLGDPDDMGARELQFKESPNFESPADANLDNAYKVSIVATDKKGLKGTKDLTIRVLNIDEDGAVKLSTIQPGVGQEITATLTDPDMGTTGAKWQWYRSETSGGTQDEIDGATSASYTPTAPTEDNAATLGINEEDPGDEGKFLHVTVDYRDNASPKDDPTTAAVDESTNRNQTQSVTSENAVRAVPDVNNAPMFESASMMRDVDENSKEDADVGDPVKADDADDDVLTYSLSGGADMASFGIDDETGQILVGANPMLDFEGGQATYVVEVKAADPFGESDTTTVTITVVNVNEPPDLMLIPGAGGTTPATPDNVGGRELVSVVEGTSAVGDYETTIGNPTWTLLGVDMDDFSISGGALSFSSPPDYEAATDANNDNVYMVIVVASNGGGQLADLAVTVTVINDTSDDETTTPTPGAFDPLAEYDADDDGSINKEEVFMAIDDYFDGLITKPQVFEIIDLYFE